VGPGGFFEPTLAWSRVGGAAAMPPPRKDFFCFTGYLARVPFETTTVIVEGRVHGVSTRSSWPLRKVWSTVAGDPYLLLPDLVGEVVGVDFLDGQPISTPSTQRCGQRPRARLRVLNEGTLPTPHVVAHVRISPSTGSAAHLCPSREEERFDVVPPLAPGASYEFERDFGSDVYAAPGAMVHIDVDSGLEVVEVTKFNNRQSRPVPTCGDPGGCR
jgi:hypothetical protein